MSYRLLIKLAALASTCWLSIGHALAETRMALVIGNSSYTNVTALPNPANDAKAMAKFLTSAGFQVMQAPNLTQADMRRTVSNFAGMVAEKGPDTVALVFYAGHGLQVDGENYLVPIDASIQREGDVALQSMRLADVMNALATLPSKARIVILDACRNNPFSEINKTTGHGLAIVDAPNGSLVSYSTAPGTEAQDGDGANSPYTSALMKIGQEPGLPIEQALKRVRLAVNDATGHQQTPWESSSLTSEFSFFPPVAGSARTAPPSAGLAPVSATPISTGGAASATAGGSAADVRSVETWRKELKSHTAREAYEIVIREDKVEAYQAYLALYPSQSVAPVVRTIVERRREMIAWYNAVTINTVVSYQNFLTSYGNSDFAATANRLLARASTRSVSAATTAFAAAGPTCPCSLPGAPATPRLKRADVAPAGNGAGGASPNGPAAGISGGGGVAVYNPPAQVDPVTVVPPPVRVVTPPYLPPVHLPPGKGRPQGGGDGEHGSNGKSSGDGTRGSNGKSSGDGTHGSNGKSAGDGKPSRGIDKPSYGRNKVDLTGVRSRDAKVTTTKVTLNRSVETPHVRSTNGFSGNVMHARSMPMTSGFASRGIMFGRGMGGMGMGMGHGFGGGFGGFGRH